jgi:hypothetical protein
MNYDILMKSIGNLHVNAKEFVLLEAEDDWRSKIELIWAGDAAQWWHGACLITKNEKDVNYYGHGMWV